MKAVHCTAYGNPDVLKLVEVPQPTFHEDECMIRIHATAVNSGETRIRRADPWAVRLLFGFSKPRRVILGGVFSGEVIATGSAVSKFRVGDQVFGSTGMEFGAYAEYKALKESATVALKPDSLTHLQAAVIPFGALTALYFLRKANIRPGQKVLIYGASGAVGSAALQLAKQFGAEVTAVCSGSNAGWIRELGADHVIDYHTTDLTTNNEQYDVVYETVNKWSFSECSSRLKKGGVLILGAAGFTQMLRAGFARLTGEKVLTGVIKESTEGLQFVKELVDRGAYRPVLDHVFTLDRIRDAHAYVDLGHKKGNVAIQVTPEG